MKCRIVRRSSVGVLAPIFGSTIAICAGAIGPAAAATAPADAAAATDASSDTSSGMLEEIVVTAQRRSENLQSVPITVNAVSGDQLGAEGVPDLQSLQIAVPGLYVENSNGSAIPILRGVGSTAVGPGIESPIAIYVDGVYYGASTGQLFSLNNIAQIEVLKGPQGTLFGRNATGGLVQINTRTPQQDFTGDVQVSYGNYDTTNENFYLTGGLAPNIAADLAVQYTHQGQGYGRDLTTGEDIYRTAGEFDVRSKWLFTPTQGTRITLSMDYENSRNSQLAFRLLPGTTPGLLTGPAYGGSPWDTEGTQPFEVAGNGGASIHFEQDLGFARFESITAYRKTSINKGLDLDATAADFETATVAEQDDQLSEEIHILSRDDSRVKWQAGAYYYDADGRYTPVNEVLSSSPAENPLYPLGAASIISSEKTRSIAGFAQATTEILPKTNLTLGARYTEESHHITGAESAELIDGTSLGTLATTDEGKTFSKATYRAAVDRKLTDDVMAFTSFNTGFKSGGFSPSVLGAPGFLPETLNAYETGIKTDMLSHTLRLNLSLFDYSYKNIQVEELQTGTIGVINGAGARVYGADLDTQFRATNQLTLTGGLEYLHARYTSFPDAPFGVPGGGVTLINASAAGHALPVAPNVTLDLGANYTVPLPLGSLQLNALYAYNSGYFVEPDNNIHQSAFNQVNASMRWYAAGNHLSVSLWGKNLTNAAFFTAAFTYQNGNEAAGYAPPRTFGVSLEYQL
jgi:iron complex outermembrane receptor protein